MLKYARGQNSVNYGRKQNNEISYTSVLQGMNNALSLYEMYLHIVYDHESLIHHSSSQALLLVKAYSIRYTNIIYSWEFKYNFELWAECQKGNGSVIPNSE